MTEVHLFGYRADSMNARRHQSDSRVLSPSRGCQPYYKYLLLTSSPTILSIIYSVFVFFFLSSTSSFDLQMTVTRRGDSTVRGHAATSSEPVPLAIVPPLVTRSGAVRLVPPEDRLESTWLANHESVLRRAYDIGPSVNVFFQEPGSLGIAGGEVTLTERMLMAGVWLPFPKIVREVCAFLGVAPGQIAPNGWRYVVASSILWRGVLGTEMDAAQFFSIYRPSTKDGAVELRVRQDPIFIHLEQRKYGNNKGWREQFFRVSGEWESPSQSVIPDSERVPREWRPLVDDLRIPPRLSVAKVKEVNTMLSFSARAAGQSSIDYENLVSIQSLNECFGYRIPEQKVILDKRGTPITGWSVTTSRPIPGKVPRKVAPKGSTSGRPAVRSPRRTRALKAQQTQVPVSRGPEVLPDRSSSDSSIGSDDSIMREIDEVADAASEEEEGNSSPAVKILPPDPRMGPSSPRSPPISFEDTIEEVITAAVPIEAAERSTISPTDSDLPPRPAVGSVVPHEVSSIQQKGKRVATGADEGPEPKKPRAQRDSGFMVNRILAMAKIYAPPSSQNPPIAVSLPAPTVLESHPVDSVACPEPEPTPGIEVAVEGEVPPSGSPIHPPLREEPDTFSQEFDKLQEEVASEREALERGLTISASPPRPDSPVPIPDRAVPQASTSVLPDVSAATGRRQDFRTDELAGCPLEALSSLVSPDYSPLFGQLPVASYAEQLTRKILQVCDPDNIYLG
jgi:hypothetical protein